MAKRPKREAVLYPLVTLHFGDGSGLEGAIAYVTPDVELTEMHIRSIIEARQMTMEWALVEDKDRMEGWNPWKWA